jgi:hypothetical protein
VIGRSRPNRPAYECCAPNDSVLDGVECCPPSRILTALPTIGRPARTRFCCPPGDTPTGDRCCTSTAGCSPCATGCPPNMFCRNGQCERPPLF